MNNITTFPQHKFLTLFHGNLNCNSQPLNIKPLIPNISDDDSFTKNSRVFGNDNKNIFPFYKNFWFSKYLKV